MPEPDYYAILQVSPDATPEAIQSAYRALSKQYHPDTGHPDASAGKMQALNEAYRVLSDGRLRQAYDKKHRRHRPAHARRAPLRAGDRALELAPDLSLPLVGIAAGEFLMGGCSPAAGEVEGRPAARLYPVYLPAYYIGIYPVTVAQYAAFVRDTGRRSTAWARRSDSFDPYELGDPSTITRLDRTWQHPFGSHSTLRGKLDHPVMVVDWFDATAFCAWVGKVTGAAVSLPSAAQWQKAARGADGRCYPWGAGPPPGPALCNCRRAGQDDGADTTPVGTFSPRGDSPYGCADMLGNVWEWTSTRGRADDGTPFGDPYRPDDGREDQGSRDPRLVMGGSLFSRGAELSCASARELNPLWPRDTGFRVCVAA